MPPSLYALSDWVMALFAWCGFYFLRKDLLGEPYRLGEFLLGDPRLWAGLLCIPAGWLALFTLTGSYRDIYRKSRFGEGSNTLITVLTGSVILFFLFLLDDETESHQYYYAAFGLLFGLHALLIFAGRLFLLSRAKAQLRSGTVSFPALIIGEGTAAARLYEEARTELADGGFVPIGYLGPEAPAAENPVLPWLGLTGQLEETVRIRGVRLVLLAAGKEQEHLRAELLNRLADLDVDIRWPADTLDILSGSVRTDNVLGAVLVHVHTGPMSEWQQNIKRLIDVGVAVLGLLLLWPLMLYVALRVRLSSAGPILYFQERVGYRGRPFRMIKFRSMFPEAEKNGPALSSDGDPRITTWGRTMRKWRLDELPQLLNILAGEMSLVGPRPERRYYIDQILPQFPYY
ncbi:MAG TPA: sugar transferase, partial [Chitinophagaceae bacterium]|nr:sugar transferase [Chitinophagaceae bacterium]